MKYNFEVQESTLRFLYEVDLYWENHRKTKSTLAKKLKPLCMLSKAHRAFFFYRDPSKFFLYKVLKHWVSKEDFINSFDISFFRDYYNTLCGCLHTILSGLDIKGIHSMYKDVEFPLLKDTLKKCLC